jgi:hypothetical protein
MTKLIVFYVLVTILLTAAVIQQQSLASPLQPKPKPGTLLIITFENGTSKTFKVDSTTILPVTGGYLIVDPTVVPGQPLPAQTISNKVVNQINTAIAIAITIIQPPPLPPPPPPPPPNDTLPAPPSTATTATQRHATTTTPSTSAMSRRRNRMSYTRRRNTGRK